MKYAITVLLLSLAAAAHASSLVSNSQIINVSVSSKPASGFNQMIDLGAIDSASWQMNFTCAKGSATISASNDGVNFVSLNVTGSSLTVNGLALTTLSNQLYAIAAPAYRYVQFNVTNSSASAGVTVAPCTFNATQALKSSTIISN